MKKEIITEQNMFICLGVKADLKKLPIALVLPLKEPFEAGGLKFGKLIINNYALYRNHSPEGCTALTCLLLGSRRKNVYISVEIKKRKRVVFCRTTHDDAGWASNCSGNRQKGSTISL